MSPHHNKGYPRDEGDTIHQTSKHCRANDGQRKATLQALHTDAVDKAVKSHERNVVLDGRPPPISSSEKELTRINPRSTKIWILYTHGLLQEQNQEGCKSQRLCRVRHDAT